MVRVTLKRIHDRRKIYEKVVESLECLKTNTDIVKVIAKDLTNETEGYVFSVDDLITNYKHEIEVMNNQIQNRMREGN